MRYLLASALLLALGCATPPKPAAEKQAWEVPAAPRPGAQQRATLTPAEIAAASQRRLEANPAGWAAAYKTSVECEAAARQVRAVAADSGWRGIRACSQRPDFKVFKRLNDGFWDSDLRARPDAPLVLGAALAHRGGDLGSDLSSLRKRRIPLFTLETAISYPNIYKGRQIVFVARVDRIEPDRGSLIVTLSEQSLLARGAGTTTEWKGSTYSGMDSHGRRYAVEDNAYGHYETRTRYDNNLEDTGVVMLSRLTKPDPFFEPGRSFLIVGRLTGIKASEDSEHGTPIVVIDGYYELGTHDLLDE